MSNDDLFELLIEILPNKEQKLALDTEKSKMILD